MLPEILALLACRDAAPAGGHAVTSYYARPRFLRGGNGASAGVRVRTEGDLCPCPALDGVVIVFIVPSRF